MFRIRTWLIRLLSIGLLAPSSFGEEKSSEKALWEFGMAAFSVYSPLYPASKDSQLNGLIVPYGVYRGDFIQLGEDSFIKGIFFDREDYEVDVSARGSFSANSEDSEVREGMPDLDFLGEIGPQLTYHALDEDGYDIDLNIPIRAVFSSDFSGIEHRGYVFNPSIVLERSQILEGLNLSVDLGFSYATEKLHAYFYEVGDRFSTPERPSYEANSGYLGADLGISFSYALTDSVNLFLGGQLASFHGAANRDSPLFEDELTFSFGAGLVWKLYESEARAFR